MNQCELCGKSAGEIGLGDKPICLDCFKSDAGLLRKLIEERYFNEPLHDNTSSPAHLNISIKQESGQKAVAREQRHFEKVGIDSVDSAVSRFLDELSGIDTRKFAAELMFHHLLSQGVGQSMGQDIGLPPNLTEYLLGVVATVDRGNNTDYDFYEILDRCVDVSRSIVHFQYEEGGISDDEVALHTATAPVISAFSTGEFASGGQHRQAARMAYSPHSEKLKETLGFDVKDALEFTNLTIEFWDLLYDRLFNRAIRVSSPELLYADFIATLRFSQPEKYRGFLPIRKEVEKLPYPVNSLWASEEAIMKIAPNDSTKKFSSFIDRMSLKLGSAENYRLPHQFNPINGSPLISSENEILSPLPGKCNEVLANTFYFDLLEAPNYRGTLSNQMGTFVEDWTYNAMSGIFDESKVWRNVEHDVGETDLIVLSGETLIIIECKRKGLTLDTRKGGAVGYKQIKEDVAEGIGNALIQAENLIELLESTEEIVVNTDRETFQITEEEYTNIKVCIVVGDSYDIVATTLYTDLIKFEQIFPYVVDIYNIDIICEVLENGSQFNEYIQRRTKITKDLEVYSPDETDYLIEYLENGLDFRNNGPTEFVSITNPGNDLRKNLEEERFNEWDY